MRKDAILYTRVCRSAELRRGSVKVKKVWNTILLEREINKKENKHLSVSQSIACLSNENISFGANTSEENNDY